MRGTKATPKLLRVARKAIPSLDPTCMFMPLLSCHIQRPFSRQLDHVLKPTR